MFLFRYNRWLLKSMAATATDLFVRIFIGFIESDMIEVSYVHAAMADEELC